MNTTSLILVIPVILAVALVIMIVRRNITEKGSRDIDIAGVIPAVVILFVAVLLISSMATSSDPTYSFDRDSGELTIKQNIDEANSYPWASYAADVKEINIRNGVTQVPAGALSMLTSVEAVTIPSSLADPSGIFGVSFADPTGTSIVPTGGIYAGLGDGTVYKCVEEAFTYSGSSITGLSTDYSSASYVVLPSKHGSTALTSVAQDAFYLKGLKVLLSVPDSTLTSFERNSFRANVALEIAVLPDSLTNLGRASFYDCSALSEAILPDRLVTIGQEAFNNTALTEIDLPDTVTELGIGSLSKTHLGSIDIPASVTTIGASAFTYCTSLTEVKLSGSPTIGASAFNHDEAVTSVTFSDDFDGSLAVDWCPWTFYEADGTTEILKTLAAALAGHTFAGTYNSLVMQS